MQVVIPTRGRAGDQPAFDFLREAGYFPLLIGNGPEDIPFYARDYEYEYVPHEHVGQVRQHILNTKHGMVAMFDDDVRLHRRKEDGMFRRAHEDEVPAFFVEMEEYLREYAIVGVAQRFMGQHNPRNHMLNKRVLHVMAYNTELLPRPWPTFRLRNSEDTDFQLQVMTRGRDVCIMTEWAVDDKGKYREGGCATYRPHQGCEAEQQSAEQMLEFWPGIVSVDRRGQLRVAWKKAAP